jgi:hypothetical protein
MTHHNQTKELTTWFIRIKDNHHKIRAMIQMKPPQSRKDIQKLTGKIVALNKFIAKLAERNLPFFTVPRAPQILNGPRTAADLQRSQSLSSAVTNAIKSRTRLVVNYIHLRFTHGNQWSLSQRKRGH